MLRLIRTVDLASHVYKTPLTGVDVINRFRSEVVSTSDSAVETPIETKFPHLTVEGFLEAAGGPSFAKFSSHFTTVDEVLDTKSRKLKRVGLSVKERKQLLKRVDHFRHGVWAPKTN
mmetsp:Transcript_13400/g.18317  ORF Transcript_13400/g.18317 Transcript_13400/m.18317 type:complete len:117 (-) Transcript_13400:272-622(-)